jgi:inosine-uridine nucleoside N-ribohydrolase
MVCYNHYNYLSVFKSDLDHLKNTGRILAFYLLLKISYVILHHIIQRRYRMKNFVKRMFLVGFVFILVFSSLAAAPVAHPVPAPVKMVIDADIGVDDAAAIAYLLNDPSKVQILGITNVAGNTTVENSANNALIMLETAQRTDIPVVVGAAAPLVLPASHQGMFVHGPDGLWFTSFGFPPHDLSGLSHDAAGFLCSKAQAGVVLLALGPLTNVANAVQLCPNAMKLYKIVWMGGAKSVNGEGNTPVSVFNPWFDPDAAEIVLQAEGLSLTMLTSDAARTVTVTTDMIDKLNRRGTALGKLIAPALQQYASLFATPRGRHGKPRVALFDPAAAVLAVKPNLGTAQSGLVLVQTPDGPARGQTIFAFTFGEHISVLATDAELSAIADQVFSDPEFDLNAALGAILSRRADNAQVILTVDSKKISQEWISGVTR